MGQAIMAADAGAEVMEGADIFYVCKKALQTCKDKVSKGEEVTQELVNELTFPENLPDDEIMVPVDMRGVGTDFDDVEQMMEKLGAKGTIEAFIKAADYFDANKDNEPEEERPKPMTAAEWKQVLEEDGDVAFEGEEECALEGDEEEEAAEDGEEGGEEPEAKKAKTE